MQISKDNIQKSFSKASKTYENSACVQNTMAHELVELLPKVSFESVLEIGCGTGLLSSLILNNLKLSSLTLNDLSLDMLNLCKEKFEDTAFLKKINCTFSKDADKLELTKLYSLIISNACFQWLKDLEQDLLNYTEHLDSEGVLALPSFQKIISMN